jgi:hypothetical protein
MKIGASNLHERTTKKVGKKYKASEVKLIEICSFVVGINRIYTMIVHKKSPQIHDVFRVFDF